MSNICGAVHSPPAASSLFVSRFYGNWRSIQINPSPRLRLPVFEASRDDIDVRSDKVLTGRCCELGAKFYASDLKSAYILFVQPASLQSAND